MKTSYDYDIDNHLQTTFNNSMNELFNEYKETDKFMALLTNWINRNEEVLMMHHKSFHYE